MVVTATFVDKYGRSIATDQNTLTAIPAGRVFYYAGAVFPNVSLTVVAMHLVLTTTATQPKSLVLPPVSDVLVKPGGSEEENVTGKLTNPYRIPIPSDGTIYAVFFNAKGNVVGGNFDLTGAAVEPGATVSFSFSEYPPPEIASARASVDPCGGSLGTCPVRVPRTAY